MKPETAIDRRRALTAGVGFLMGLPAVATAAPQEEDQKNENKINPDEGVTAPEDLMKEHGVLNRCLLIYEEGVRRLHAKQEITPIVFNHTARLIKLFVEEYHEKNEENHIFPVFKKAGKLMDLVHILKTQHKAGRVVTGAIIRLSAPDQFKSVESRE